MDFTEFYLLHRPRILASVAFVLGDLAEAEDITQDAFEVAARNWHKIAHYDRPDAWVRRVAHHRAFNVTRRAQRQLKALARLAGHQRDAEPVAAELLDVHRALQSLTVRDRRILSLRYVLDLSVVEIAEETELPVSTVKGALLRARRKLAASMDAGHDAGNPEARPLDWIPEPR